MGSKLARIFNNLTPTSGKRRFETTEDRFGPHTRTKRIFEADPVKFKKDYKDDIKAMRARGFSNKGISRFLGMSESYSSKLFNDKD